MLLGSKNIVCQLVDGIPAPEAKLPGQAEYSG